MTSHEIRRAFLQFFESKQHKIVPSAPLVLKNDPTLMFTNSGMVQFKDYFLGNGTPPSTRIADTQKCLRVSGKHNDLEDVGFDGTHHTMFEMLGNWSFGDYFKEDAIAWSFEFLTVTLGLPKDRLYASVFGGDDKEGLASDEEARGYWRKYLPDNQILDGSKKDNFWEMGAQGPCGPCSEIHFDFRSDEERAKVPGEKLVNQDDPQVVEIWNNVFMQFERKADGSLVVLPAQHVDTGMGFERLCMVMQNKLYTYDTDVFTPLLNFIEAKSGKKYTGSYERTAMTDVAMRVVADHIRAVAFTIADGQLPSSGGAGYVIRRILRRAVRYYYSFLEVKEPFFNQLVPILASEFADVFPELKAQQEFVQKVILAEEESFLRTLESGLKKIELYFKGEMLEDCVNLYLERNGLNPQRQFGSTDIGIDIILRECNIGIELKRNPDNKTISNFELKKDGFKKDLLLDRCLLITEYDFLNGKLKEQLEKHTGKKLDDNFFYGFPGKISFELLDTYGFPIDLTELIAREKGYSVDNEGFEKALQEQKQRSKKDAAKQVGDWSVVLDEAGVEFVGYDQLQVRNAKVLKYRTVEDKKGTNFHIVLNRTPFYAESGGQAGDTGHMVFDGGEKIQVLDTKKENDLVIHIVDKLPQNIEDENVFAQVNAEKRQRISSNHSAVHLMHAALHQVVGTHALQKGQSVDDQRLRFDFSHFQQVTKEELAKIETMVNAKIRENIALDEVRNMPIEDAKKTGAMMLFGEKYGETVRVITFGKDYSVELCGGTHVAATGEIAYFKIVSEGAVSAGVRRVEALTGEAAEAYINAELAELQAVRDVFKNPKDTAKRVNDLFEDNKKLQKEIERLMVEQAAGLQKDLRTKFTEHNGFNLLVEKIGVNDANAVKTLAYNLEKEIGNAVIVFGTVKDDKPMVTVRISDDLAKAKNLNAGAIVRELAKEMKGGGGGAASFATAGGSDLNGLDVALGKVKGLI